MTEPTIGLGGGFGEPTGGGVGTPPAIRGYEIGDRLGEGGYGEVWKATRLDPGPRVVAIKVLRTRVATARDADRFRREAALLARLDHPGIATVLDSGTLDDGRPWFAIEFVDGRPLGDLLDESCPLEERLELVRQACGAIAHAHARGIVHCDLKPANILVAGSPGRRTVKVIDFGVARLHEGEQPGSTLTVDATGGVLGTPAYMAPEQLTSGDIDTRVDVWAMGVVLTELLAGRRPFETAPEDGGMLEEQRRIREEEPTAPSAGLTTILRRDPGAAETIAARRGRALDDLVRTLRRELDWVVMRCLARRPEDRYASVSALSEDLGRYLRHEPLEAGPPDAGYRIRKFVRRHRAAVAAAAAMVVLLLAGIAGTSVGLVRATRSATLQREARESAERRLDQFGEINALNRRILTIVNPDLARGLDTTLLERTLESSASLVPEDADPLVRSQLFLTLGESWSHLDKADRALELMRAALDEAATSATQDGEIAGLTDELGLAEIGGSLGKVLIDASRSSDAETRKSMRDEAETRLREAIEVNTRTLGPDHVRTLQDRANLAWLMMITGRLEDGLTEMRDVHGRRLAILGPQDKSTLGSASLLSDVLIKLGRSTPSRYEEARDVVVELLGERPDPTRADSSPAELVLLNNLAIAESRLGNQSERLRLLDGIAERIAPVFGPENLVTLTIRYNHATTLIDRGRFADADASLQSCLAGYRARTSPGSTQVVRTLGRLGQSARLDGRPSDARRWFTRLLDESTEAAGDETTPAGIRRERHLDASGALLQLAVLARLDGRAADARGRLAESSEQVESAGGDPILPGLIAAEVIEVALANPATDDRDADAVPDASLDLALDLELDLAAEAIVSTLESIPESKRRERAAMRLALGRLDWTRTGDPDEAAETIAAIEALIEADGTRASLPIAEAVDDWRAEILATNSGGSRGSSTEGDQVRSNG